MRSRRASLALAGTIAVAGLTGGVVLGPAIATAASGQTTPATAVSDRVERIKQALQGLVDDKTINTQQRDKIASTLADKLPPPGRGPRPGRDLALDAAAQALGMTQAELVTQLRSGKSIATVAKDRGVALDKVTAALQKAAEDRLAQAVQNGRLTQAQADAEKAELPQKIADAVQRAGAGPGKGRGWGPGGAHGDSDQGTPGDGDQDAPSAPPAPSASQQPSSYVPA